MENESLKWEETNKVWGEEDYVKTKKKLSLKLFLHPFFILNSGS